MAKNTFVAEVTFKDFHHHSILIMQVFVQDMYLDNFNTFLCLIISRQKFFHSSFVLKILKSSKTLL